MKKIAFLIVLLLPFLTTAKEHFMEIRNIMPTVSITFSIHQDSLLPPCIKKLTHPASKAIRTSIGAVQYKNELTLKNGQKLYALSAQVSIGCHINEPRKTIYYDDSCRHVATFYTSFTLKYGKKPFMAEGYLPEDFPETLQGDYPEYFTQEKTKNPININGNSSVTNNLFSTEKSFKIMKVIDSTFFLKKDDVISISTKTGLKHYRNNKLINTYKIIPQIVGTNEVEKKQTVYYMNALRKLIYFKDNAFLVSTESFEDTPNTPVSVKWKTAYELLDH